ncbi:MAG TPA: TonB-dependent receptor [Armatimonadota bacterium]|nr:TonB-dependent receptor [Armatimonadota bacterium]
MKTSGRLFIITVLTAVLTSSLLWADDTTPTPSDDKEPDATIVITDTKTPHPVSESIATTTVVTAQTMQKEGAQTALDALRFVPGLTIRQNGEMGGSSSTSIRGLVSKQMLVLVDGQRISSPALISGVDLSKFPTDDISRIEVLRGPASSLYGSDAIGGVINIITKKPTKSGGTATYSIGSHGRSARDFTVKDAGEKVQWLLSGSFPDYDGQRTNSQFAATDFSGRIIFPDVKKWELAVRAENYSDDQGVPGSTFYPSPNDKQSFDRNNINLTAKRDIAGGDLDLSVYATQQKLDNESTYGDTSAKGDTYATEANYNYQLGNHQLAFGGEYRKEQYHNISAPLPEIRESISNKAIYAQDRWAIADKTDLVYGARLDDHSTAGSKITPRIGINRAIAKNTNVRASYAVGFRAPNFIELYYNSPDPNYGTIGNPHLKPETSQQFEVGIATQKGKSSLDLALFNTAIRDEITWSAMADPLPNYQSTYLNVNRSTHYGAELSYGYTPSKLTNISLSYSYTKAFNSENGQRLTGIPYNMLTLTASQTIHRWDITLSGRWVDERPDFSGLAPSFATLDLTIQPNGSGRVLPYLTIRNLTNTSYEEVLGYPAESRSLEFGLRSAW